MKLSSDDSTAPADTGVTLHDTRRALVAGAVGVHEARVHAALVLNPTQQGLSGIEAACGLDRMVLMGRPGRGDKGILPAEGCSTVLLYCGDRGVFALEPDERRPMEVSPLPFGSSAKWSSGYQDSVPTTPPPSSKEKGGTGGDDLEGKELGALLGSRMTTSVEAPWVERHQKLLRPDRGLWENRPYGNQRVLGDAGWAIALVYGFEVQEVPLADLQRLLGLGPKQTKRVVDRLGFARTSGRGAVATLDLTLYACEQAEEEQWFSRVGMRAVQKAVVLGHKQKNALRRATSHGYAAYRIVQHLRRVALRLIDADREEYVRWALEPAEVPENAEALSASQEAEQTAEAPEVAETAQEAQDAPQVLTRALIRERLARPPVPMPSPPAPMPRERQEGETWDDHFCRVNCEGKPNLFFAVTGHLPNQPPPEPTPQQQRARVKARRAQEAREERRRQRATSV